ncbi:MAG: squalene/phytoene synthase family protein [Pseudomonadota bacterium]
MSLAACAEITRRGDPLRFRAAMAASPDVRRVLFPIYAFNVEVSRTPWITEEPMIAEMRLQWWRDVLNEIRTGKPVRSHDVAAQLAAVLDPDGAPALDRLVAARRWDIYKAPFEDSTHFDEYISKTAGTLMSQTGRLLGADDLAGAADAGWAAGLAAFFQAVPELRTRGRQPLVDESDQAIAELADTGLRRLARARAGQLGVPVGARAAFYPAAEARLVLETAKKNPRAVLGGGLGRSEFALRARFLWVAVSGRW